MNLLLLTPALEGSLAGNRATAERWANLLEEVGHRVTVGTGYTSSQANKADLMIALHAWRSREAVASWRQEQGNKPLIVVLTGTDIYRFLVTDPEHTLPAMEQANQLIILHRLAWQDIPVHLQGRTTLVLQSAERPKPPVQKESDYFDVCVVGHLRDEKDPLRAALAARKLPPASALRVLQAGRAHSLQWEQRALQEMADNPRYHWLGELDRETTEQLLANSHAMVISSVMEGGANVVSEACRAGLPILASDISGNRGLLGEHYPGLFPPEDEAALARLLARAENDTDWRHSLSAITSLLAEDFIPERELASLEDAMARALTPSG